MRRFTAVALIVMLAFSSAVMLGCGSSESTALDAVTKAYGEKGAPAGTLLAVDYKAALDPVKDGSEPDSHQMMAMFILQGAGRNSDLSTYKQVELVEVSVEDGTSFMSVVIDGNDVVFPQSLETAE